MQGTSTAAGHGTVPVPALDGLPAVRWQVPGDVAMTAHSRVRPVVAGGLVWHQTDRLRAHDVETGEQRHEIEIDWPFTMTGIAVTGDVLLVPVPASTPVADLAVEAWDGGTIPGGGRLAGVDASTWAVRWVKQTMANPSVPAVVGDTAWLTVDGQTLMALDTEPGTRPLRQHARYSFSAPIVVDGKVIVSRPGESYPIEPSIHALDAATSEPTWSIRTDTFVSARMVATDRALIVPFDSGVQAIDPTDGTVLWTNRVSPGFVVQDQPVVAGDVIYLGQWHGAIDARDGTWLWHGQTQTKWVGSPCAAEGIAAFSNWGDGTLTVLEGNGVAVSQRTVPEPIAGEMLPIVDVSGPPPCAPTLARTTGISSSGATPAIGGPVSSLPVDTPADRRPGQAPPIDLLDLPNGTPADRRRSTRCDRPPGGWRPTDGRTRCLRRRRRVTSICPRIRSRTSSTPISAGDRGERRP